MSTSALFEHSYHSLGSDYVTPTVATPVSAPKWLAWNTQLAEQLGWPEHWGHNDSTLNTLAGNTQFESSKPGAAAYAATSLATTTHSWATVALFYSANGDAQTASY